MDQIHYELEYELSELGFLPICTTTSLPAGFEPLQQILDNLHNDDMSQEIPKINCQYEALTLLDKRFLYSVLSMMSKKYGGYLSEELLNLYKKIAKELGLSTKLTYSALVLYNYRGTEINHVPAGHNGELYSKCVEIEMENGKIIYELLQIEELIKNQDLEGINKLLQKVFNTCNQIIYRLDNHKNPILVESGIIKMLNIFFSQGYSTKDLSKGHRKFLKEFDEKPKLKEFVNQNQELSTLYQKVLDNYVYLRSKLVK